VAAEYPHLLRTAGTRWWHPLAGLAVLVVGWAIPAGVLTRLLSAVGGADVNRGNSAIDVTAVGLSIALLIPGAVAAVVLVHRARPGVLLSGPRRPRAVLFAVGVAVATPAFVPMVLAKTAAFDAVPDPTGGAAGWVGWPAFLPLFAAIVLVFPFQSAAEEIVFRGYLPQAIASWTHRAWPAAVTSSLMFVAIHNTHDVWTFADRFFFGLALCWLTWRTGGLEAAIALHVTYNVLLGLAVAATGRMGALVNASRSDALGTLTSMAGTALAVLTLAWWAERRQVAVRTVPEGEAVYA
jgi:membrane protease YdiL (CAAX protease family)